MQQENPSTSIQCSTSVSKHIRLALKLFREEPAITKLDQLFTSNHSSSPGIVQPVGADLPRRLKRVHPGHGQLALVSGRIQTTKRAINPRFHYVSVLEGLKQSRLNTLVGSFCKRHPVTPQYCEAPSPCKPMISGSISPPLPGYFSPFPHGTSSLSNIKSIQSWQNRTASFPWDSRPMVLKNNNQEHKGVFIYGTITLFGSASQQIRLTNLYLN